MTKPDNGRKDAYNLSALKKSLKEKGFDLFFFPEVESTMKVVEEHARKGKGDAIIVLTEHQAKGEGRAGRIWNDKPGKSLMFSVLSYIPQSSVATYADLVSLSICKTLSQKTGLPIKIKYPNDIVINDNKLGGILVKNIYDDKFKYLGTNVGIGINVHYSKADLDNFHTDYPATSLDINISGLRSLHSLSVGRDDKKIVTRQDLLIDILSGLVHLGTEVVAIEANPNAREIFEKKWKEVSSIIGRNIAIIKNDTIISTGKVVDTGIGKGIELQTKQGGKWISMFETDMKARVV